MTRPIVALLLSLFVMFQASLTAAAGIATPLTMHCAESKAAATVSNDCCPAGNSAAFDCCQDACPALVASTGATPVSFFRYEPTKRALPSQPQPFGSRADSPLIRPPIL